MKTRRRQIHVASLTFQEPTKPAAILIDSPNIAILNQKLNTDCASAVFLIAREVRATSDVCAATAIVNEKYKKSQ